MVPYYTWLQCLGLGQGLLQCSRPLPVLPTVGFHRKHCLCLGQPLHQNIPAPGGAEEFNFPVCPSKVFYTTWWRLGALISPLGYVQGYQWWPGMALHDMGCFAHRRGMEVVIIRMRGPSQGSFHVRGMAEPMLSEPARYRADPISQLPCWARLIIFNVHRAHAHTHTKEASPLAVYIFKVR